MADITSKPRERADYESSPLSRSEYIAALVHLYRGELDRATTWRIRLDNTTNWAVLTTAGMLSLTFGDRDHTHLVLLVGLLLLSVFWVFEARRYRFADIWYHRVRRIEENFYGPILRRDPVSPLASWGELVAEDLFRPRFKVTRMQALRMRLLRNYGYLLAVVIVAWAIKVVVHPVPARTWEEVRLHLEFGAVPWWVPPGLVAGFVLACLALLVFGPRKESSEQDRWNLSP
jgi:uncharacterized membrane protein